MSAHHVILVGLMGSGKSAVGRRVAARLERPFTDTDAELEARTGRTVGDFIEEDEAGFRAAETEVVATLLAAEEPTVIAAAGGTVLDAGSRARIAAAGTVIWLRAEPETLVPRVQNGRHRRLGDDPLTRLQQMQYDRVDLYREVADAVVDVDHLTLDEVVDEVLERAW